MRKLLFLLIVVLLTASVAAQDIGATLYIGKVTVNARACAKTTCKVVAKLRPGTAVVILELVDGATVKKSTKWYRIQVDGKDAFVHSSLVTDKVPVVKSQAVSTATPDTSTIPPPVSSGASCPSLSATCSQLTCDQAYACLNAGNGKLDRDKDGVPCESVCPGG